MAEPVEGAEGAPLGRPFGFDVALAPAGGAVRPLGALEGTPSPWSTLVLALADGSVFAEGAVCMVCAVELEPVFEPDGTGEVLSTPEGALVAVPVA